MNLVEQLCNSSPLTPIHIYFTMLPQIGDDLSLGVPIHSGPAISSECHEPSVTVVLKAARGSVAPVVGARHSRGRGSTGRRKGPPRLAAIAVHGGASKGRLCNR